MDEAFTYLATTTRTTTLMTLEILAPMPFQGDWSGGATMFCRDAEEVELLIAQAQQVAEVELTNEGANYRGGTWVTHLDEHVFSIALVDREHGPVVGVVHRRATDETISASKNDGAWLAYELLSGGSLGALLLQQRRQLHHAFALDLASVHNVSQATVSQASTTHLVHPVETVTQCGQSTDF